MNTLILDKNNPLSTRVQTRDGRPARIICIDTKVVHINGQHKTMVALVTCGSTMGNANWERLYTYYPNGTVVGFGEDCADLINFSEKQKWWVNVYPKGNCNPVCYVRKEEADKSASSERLRCVEVEL